MIKLCLSVQAESCELLARSDEYSLSAIAAEVVPVGGGQNWELINFVAIPDGMALESGKYYNQGGVTYLCNRDTGNPVYHALSELVGLYVMVVTED